MQRKNGQHQSIRSFTPLPFVVIKWLHIPRIFRNFKKTSSRSSLKSVSPLHPAAMPPSLPTIELSMKDSCKKLLLEGTLSDFTIKTGNGSLRAHKAMLAAYSPVFQTMLTSDFSEAATGVMEIPDVSLETMREFLIFLYTQDISACDALQKENPTPLLLDIMQFSHKYGLHEVVDTRASLTSFINSRKLITADSVLEFFQLSRWLDMESLRMTCLKFAYPILEEVLKKESVTILCAHDGSLAADLLLDMKEVWEKRIPTLRAGWDVDKERWESVKNKILGQRNCPYCDVTLILLDA